MTIQQPLRWRAAAALLIAAAWSPAALHGQPAVARLVAEPASLTLRVDEDAALVITAYDAAGNVIADAPVRVAAPARALRWSAGRLHAFEGGEYTVHATAGPADAPVTLAIPVRVLWPTLARIELRPPPPARLYAGSYTERTAVGLHADGTPRPELEVVWSSSDTTIATVDRFGTIAARRAGTVTITAAAEGASATERHTVLADPVRALELRIAETEVRTGDVVRLAAIARDVNGAAVADAPITWSYLYVRDDSISGPPGGAGVIERERFVANHPGRFSLVAQSGGVTVRHALRVVPRTVRRAFTVVGRGPVRHVTTTDLWPWTGADGRDYCLTGTFAGDGVAYVWDITELTNIVLTDSIRVDARTINDVMVSPSGRYAALAREGASDRRNGVVILDLSTPAHPTIAATFEQELTGGVHNLFATDEYLYAISGGQKYVIIDMADIRSPRYVGEYRHPDAGVHDLWVRDGIAYSAQAGAGTVVVDVGNGRWGGTVEDPKLITVVGIDSGHEIYPYAQPSTGKTYLFIGDEIMNRQGLPWSGVPYLGGFAAGRRGYPPQTSTGHTHIVDFTDPSDPRVVARYHVAEFGTHDIIVEDDILYQAYYEGGVRLVDVSGELLGNLYEQGREIAVYKPFDPDGVVANAPFVTNALPWKGHVLFADANSGLWAGRLEPR